MTTPTFIIGDIHGHCDKLAGLLRDAGLVDADLAWSGGDARLFLLGDYVDRGPDGIGVIDLLMGLGVEAAAAGGQVEALLGNHDVMLLAAHRFREEDARRRGPVLPGSLVAQRRPPAGPARA